MDKTLNPEIMDHSTAKDALQESQYEFPYHHLVEWDQQNFSQTKHWSWGLRYFAGLQVAVDLVRRTKFRSLIDIGCGDGRFLKELKQHVETSNLKGIDISERAIGFARAFSPDIDFEVSDVGKNLEEKRWDVATLIEVCEHVPPAQLPGFLESTARALIPGGRLVLTVPHENKALNAKHYQHFSSAKIRELLTPHFDEIEFVFFDHRSRLMQSLLFLNGGKGNFFVVTLPSVNRLFFRIYKKFFHYVDKESNCLRIACIAQTKI